MKDYSRDRQVIIKEQKNIIIGVATHKSYRMPDDEIYLPLHVGAALHPDVCQNMQGDNEGDSISEKNQYYSELTGLYWLWKNADADYKGLVHYRRLLGSKTNNAKKAKDPYAKIIRKSELQEILNTTGIVLAKRRCYYIETIYEHYSHTFDKTHFDICREVLRDLSPQYLKSWDRLMNSREAHILNMFVMRTDLFNAYCEYLFPLLQELESRLDPSNYDAFNARYIGRVSERLLDPWLETNKLTYEELPVVNTEPVNWVKKGSGFLAAKFLGKKYKKSF